MDEKQRAVSNIGRHRRMFIENIVEKQASAWERFQEAIDKWGPNLHVILTNGHLFVIAAEQQVAREVLHSYGSGDEGAMDRVIETLTYKLIQSSRNAHNSTLEESNLMGEYYRREIAIVLDRAREIKVIEDYEKNATTG